MNDQAWSWHETWYKQLNIPTGSLKQRENSKYFSGRAHIFTKSEIKMLKRNNYNFETELNKQQRVIKCLKVIKFLSGNFILQWNVLKITNICSHWKQTVS